MGVFVKGATMSIAKTLSDIKKALALGSKNRKKGETLMNKDSSRSHCMFTVYVETQESIAKSDKIKVGKLNLVDLAGSERQKKSGAANQRLKEASNINLSLTSLMNVISALVNSKKTHIPYRDSKLTRLLEDSLGGNTKTCMIANISPADYNFEETMSTLRYANRAKNIKNRPKINQDPKDTLLKEYLEEIKRLKTMLDDMKDGKEVKISIPSMKAASRPSTRNGDLDDLELSKSELLSEDENGRRYSILSDEEYKNSEEYQQVLQKKEEELNQEKNQKQELENALKELEEKLAQSNNVEKEEMVKMQQYREIQLKLEEEKAIQDKLLKEKLQKEEEMILVERDYQTLQEEVDEQRKLIRVLRNKYKDAVEEIKDLSAEANNEREYLGTALMEMQKEMSLYKSILHGAFSHDEIDRIVARSNYNPDNKVWKVPSFMFRANKLNLFNKNHDRLQDMQSQERNTHTLHFTRDKRNDSEDLTGNGALPPPAPQTPNGTRFTSKWNQNKIGRKTLADFSNERNVANRSEYYIGMEKEVKPKLKIVKKLTNSGSKVKLAPLKVGQELTDSSLESNPNITNIKSTTNMMEGKKKKIVAAAKPIDVGPGVLEDSGELKAEVKVSQGKSKVKTKTNLFSRGKGSKKAKGQRIGKLVSYIELY